MEPQTASYYRALLFADGTEARPLPASLVRLHQWVVKRNQALGLGGMITKAVALSVALTWLSSTQEGREFSANQTTLGDLFGGVEDVPETAEEIPDDAPEDVPDEDILTAEAWDALLPETDVIVTLKNKSTIGGKFIERRGNWVDVRVNGEVKHFRIRKVKLAGV